MSCSAPEERVRCSGGRLRASTAFVRARILVPSATDEHRSPTGTGRNPARGTDRATLPPMMGHRPTTLLETVCPCRAPGTRVRAANCTTVMCHFVECRSRRPPGGYSKNGRCRSEPPQPPRKLRPFVAPNTMGDVRRAVRLGTRARKSGFPRPHGRLWATDVVSLPTVEYDGFEWAAAGTSTGDSSRASGHCISNLLARSETSLRSMPFSRWDTAEGVTSSSAARSSRVASRGRS